MDVLHADGVPEKPSVLSGLESTPKSAFYRPSEALLRTQLALDQSIVLDGVVGEAMRGTRRSNAETAGAGTFWLIDTVCSDPEVPPPAIDREAGTDATWRLGVDLG